MSYESEAKAAEKAGHARAMSAPMFKFENKGDSVLGIISSQKEIKSDETDDTFSVFAMKTDLGIVQFSAGVSLSQIIIEGDLMEKLIRITFEGQVDTRKGNRVNEYTVINYADATIHKNEVEHKEDIEPF